MTTVPTHPIFLAVGEWATAANCRGISSEVFFPAAGEDTTLAESICGDCSVRLQCLNYALNNGEHFGIWGGLGTRERRRYRRLIAGSV